MAAVKIQLKSNDAEIFEVDRSVIRLSTTLDTMFQGKLWFIIIFPVCKGTPTDRYVYPSIFADTDQGYC